MAALPRTRIPPLAVTRPLASRLHGELESPRPLRAHAGNVHLVGWCLDEDAILPPSMRLRTEVGILPQTTRSERTDVPLLFPQASASHQCGFEIKGRLPAGVHLAHLEAQGGEGSWRIFKSFTLAVEERPFAAAVESPVSTGTVSERLHVEGWAIDPAREASGISLRYGHQEIACEHGLMRDDVPAMFPDTPHAVRSGFRSSTILSAGMGPLRIKARFADGSVAIARTDVQIEIECDENHEASLNLHAGRIPLPGYERRAPTPAAHADSPLKVLFVLHGDFTANSTLQACALANELADAGHACVIAVPRDVETLRHQASPRFRACLHDEAIRHGGGFADGQGPDVIHAWTTRERIRSVVTDIRERHGGRLCIQLEDNEHAILAHAAGRAYEELAGLSDPALTDIVTPELSHPRHSADFLAAADGVTVIVDRLREFVPPDKPCVTLWPAADARYFFPRPVPAEFRALLAFAPETTFLFYHGNVHAANASEMRELYAAVARLNADGVPVCLIRAGVDQVSLLEPALATEVKPHVLNLGQILNHRHLPPLMALADIFVQPGEADAFNNYRFPSKLPEFFSIGRPVVLPRANLGSALVHGEDAYVVDRADADGIANAVRALRNDPALAARLGARAAAFANDRLSWRQSAATLANFYERLTRC